MSNETQTVKTFSDFRNIERKIGATLECVVPIGLGLKAMVKMAIIAPTTVPAECGEWDTKLDRPRIAVTLFLPIDESDKLVIALRSKESVFCECLGRNWGSRTNCQQSRLGFRARHFASNRASESIDLAIAAANDAIKTLTSITGARAARLAAREATIAQALAT